MAKDEKNLAADICKQEGCELSEEARALLDDRMTARALLKLLQEQTLYVDAIRVAAYLLPRREAVWWGCLCVWQVHRSEPKPDSAEALKAVVAWVREPVEERRRAAEEAGKKLPANDAAAGLCQAVFFSGGSISKPKLPEVAPAPHLTAKRVASVVLGVSRTVKDRVACQKQFVTLAFEVADGKLGHEPPRNK
ncbi:MAG: hypothetical protein AB7K24_08340 [Gemmataceae bacterium]